MGSLKPALLETDWWMRLLVMLRGRKKPEALKRLTPAPAIEAPAKLLCQQEFCWSLSLLREGLKSEPRTAFCSRKKVDAP
jgi:hypothetical protein